MSTSKDHQIAHYWQRIVALEAELAAERARVVVLKASLRANALRDRPHLSHERIDAEIERIAALASPSTEGAE